MPNREGIISLDPGDAKFMALMERFSERLDWMRGDADQRNKQLQLQASTLGALEKGMSKMEGMISGMRDELRATAALSVRVFDVEMRTTRSEDRFLVLESLVDALSIFKDGIVNRLATVGLVSFLGGSGASLLAIKLLFGGHV